MIEKFAVTARSDRSSVAYKLGNHKSFVDVVPRRDPVGKVKESSHELWPYNKTGEKVVQTYKHARKNLSCGH